MITAVGFDWGGVLNGKPGTVFFEDMLALLEVDSVTYNTAYFSHNKKANRGDIFWDELWYLVLNDLGKLDKYDDVLTLNAKSQANAPNHEVLALVDRLRANGYRLGMLSNNSVERADILRHEGLDKHFDVFHISAETGLVKPEPEAFLRFANDLEVPMNELVFIDDMKKSLSKAGECGYTPILFENYTKLVDDLKKLGIRL